MAGYSYAQIKALAKSAGLGDAQASVAALIALAESGGNPSLRNVNSNGTVDVGLWQINTVNWPTYGVSASDLNNPATNAWVMVQLSKTGKNWQPWSASAYEDGGGGWLQRNSATGDPNPAVKKPTSSVFSKILHKLADPNVLSPIILDPKSNNRSIGQDVAGALALGTGAAAGAAGSEIGVAGGAAEAVGGAGVAGTAGATGIAAKTALEAGAVGAALLWLSDTQHLLRVVYVVGGAGLLLVGASKVANVGLPKVG